MINRAFKFYGSKHQVVSKKECGNPMERDCLQIVVGATGSGKSQLIFNLLDEWQQVNKKLGVGSRVILYSGSPDDAKKVLNPAKAEIYGPDSEQSFRDCLSRIEADALSAGGKPAESKPEPGSLGSLERARPLDTTAPGAKPKKRTRVFLAVDDAVGTSLLPTNMKSSPLGSIIIAHRHLDMTVVVCSQRFTLLPTLLRSNASYWFLFPTRSRAELAAITKECSADKDVLTKALRIADTEPHQFVYVNMPDKTVCIGFNKPIDE